MNTRTLLSALIITLTVAVSGLAIGHSGGTNSAGCHTNHSTGDYHCHNAKPQTTVPTTTYCHLINNERRCGYALSTCNSLKQRYGGTCFKDHK